jgi:hypothetical protein
MVGVYGGVKPFTFGQEAKDREIGRDQDSTIHFKDMLSMT